MTKSSTTNKRIRNIDRTRDLSANYSHNLRITHLTETSSSSTNFTKVELRARTANCPCDQLTRRLFGVTANRTKNVSALSKVARFVPRLVVTPVVMINGILCLCCVCC